MKRSESIANIASALCKFQAECPAPKKTAENPHFKSKYSPLEEIISAIKPYLAKNGLSFFQSTTTEGENICVTTLILHESGEYIESEPLKLPMGKVTAQGAGSAVTYARRYSLCAALGIAAEDDDDGNAAMEQPKATDKQLNYIDSLLTKKAGELGFGTIKGLNVNGKTTGGARRRRAGQAEATGNDTGSTGGRRRRV